MADYPVDISTTPDGSYRAAWSDFPQLPPAVGVDAKAAFEALMNASFEDVADLVAKGEAPAPSPAAGRPAVWFSNATELQAHHVGRLVGVTPKGTAMVTYGWTNDLTYVE
jgi:hypothetical protein